MSVMIIEEVGSKGEDRPGSGSLSVVALLLAMPNLRVIILSYAFGTNTKIASEL